MQHQHVNRSAHIAAKEEIRTTIASALRAVRRLDVIVETTFADDADVVAQWTQAHHVERDPQRRAPDAAQARDQGWPSGS